MVRQRLSKTTKTSISRDKAISPSLSAAPKSPLHLDLSKSEARARGTTRAMEMDQDPDDPRRPLLRGAAKDGETASLNRRPSSPTASNLTSSSTLRADDHEEAEMGRQNMSRKAQWVILAVASGTCAAFNGVFAKLTTTELTTSFATWIANLIGLGDGENVVEVVVRAIFFGLNLIFNGIMWTLFTKALARGTSTTQVSILNTSSNFMITAVLGFLIFSESLPPLWFLGAALLVAGNVIIGRRDEGEDSNSNREGDEHERAENGEGTYSSDEEGLSVGEGVELHDDLETERKREQHEDDILDLVLEEDENEGQGRRRRDELI